MLGKQQMIVPQIAVACLKGYTQCQNSIDLVCHARRDLGVERENLPAQRYNSIIRSHLCTGQRMPHALSQLIDFPLIQLVK